MPSTPPEDAIASPPPDAVGAPAPSAPSEAPVAESGTIPLTLVADGAAASDAIVSLGVPFAPGQLGDAARVQVRDAAGRDVETYAASLATWPKDASQRAVLVAFRASLGAGATETWSIAWGAPATRTSAAIAPSPDGPIVALLPADWYASSRVIGHHLPAARNQAFADFDQKLERALANMSPAWETYGLSCQTTSSERTYYDGPHALYQRFIHRATAAAYRRARVEARWYRDNELSFYEQRTIAIFKCETSWNPSRALQQATVRRMLGQGMLDDYLLTGDPAALEALRGLGEAFRQNLAAMRAGTRPMLCATERNLGWTMMGLASAYAVDSRPELLAALTTAVDDAVAWQAQGKSGAFEHDIARADPSECGDGPRGGSPFMTSLLVDGLVDAWILTGDSRIPGVVARAAAWLRDDAVTPDGEAFQYLWGCNDTDYTSSDFTDLNLLIVHVFGAAYLMSGDAAWLDFGDDIARAGVGAMYAGRPKQWNQAARTFMKYLGYRALQRTP